MKKRYYIFGVVMLIFIIASCMRSKVLDPVLENQFFRSMFRKAESVVVNNNDIELAWYRMNGAKGYRLQMRYKSESFTTPLVDTILPPTSTRILIPDLQYGTSFISRIMVLATLDKTSADTLYNSAWFGDGSDDDNMELKTNVRYAIPTIITVSQVTETSIKVSWDLTYKSTILVAGVSVPTPDTYMHAVGTDGKDRFLMDSLSVSPTKRITTELKQGIKLSAADLARGYIVINNLNPNSPYTVNVFDNKIKRFWDRHYNTINLRTLGKAGTPILVPHIVDTAAVAKLRGYSRLDTILTRYMDDITLAEGTTFLLETGKKYYCYSGVSITKGFILKSKGPGLAQVEMCSGQNADGSPRTCNFSVSRSPAGGEMGSIMIQNIRFEDILFTCPDAVKGGVDKYGAWVDGTGNYFFNQSSSAMEFVLESLDVQNCEFTGFRRGWFRTQGSQIKQMNNWIVNNCYFHDVGYRDAKGGGYSFFRGDGTSPNTNIFTNVQVTNSTFEDTAMNMLFDESKGGISYAWVGNPVWNITVQNCTFLNFNTLSSKKRIFDMEGAPVNSKITCKKNLFILTTKRLAQTNPRNNYSAGMYVKARPFTFDFSDNYGTKGFLFDSDNFNSTTTGALYHAVNNPQGSTDAAIKFGTVQILPEELMVDPDNGNLKYKNTTQVRTHEIYLQNIGDPRWR